MNTLQSTAFAYALSKAFNGPRFDICGVTDAFKLVGRTLYGTPLHATLHALHCAEWTALPVNTRVQMIDVVLVALEYDARDIIDPTRITLNA